MSNAAEYIALDLLETAPTTVAGVSALLAYTYEHEDANPQGWPQPMSYAEPPDIFSVAVERAGS